MTNIVQIIDNEGSNPGNTQEPGGLNSSPAKPLTKGNYFFGIITCADYAGPHTAEEISDTEKNVFVIDKILTGAGGAGNLATAQQTIMYHVNSLVGDAATADVIHSQFVGGDNDYEALLGVELEPCQFVGCSGYMQTNVKPGKAIVNSGAVIPYPANSTGYGVCFNISENGNPGTITPVPTAPGILVKDVLAFYEPQGNNVALSVIDLPGASGARAYFDNVSSAPEENFQTFIQVVSGTAAITQPVPTITVGSDALSALNAGKPVNLVKG